MYLYMWINELTKSTKQDIVTVHRIYIILLIHIIVHLHQNKQLDNIAVNQNVQQ